MRLLYLKAPMTSWKLFRKPDNSETVTLHVGIIKRTLIKVDKLPENLCSSVFICGLIKFTNTNCNGLTIHAKINTITYIWKLNRNYDAL